MAGSLTLKYVKKNVLPPARPAKKRWVAKLVTRRAAP